MENLQKKKKKKMKVFNLVDHSNYNDVRQETRSVFDHESGID